MTYDRRRFLELSGITLGTLAGCVSAPEANETPTATPTKTETATATPTRTAEVPWANGAITIEGTEWKLVPPAFSAEKGAQLAVTFENVGSVAHNLTFGEFPLSERSAEWQNRNDAIAHKTETIQPGNTATVTFTPGAAGDFPYWCDVSGHRDAGMKGRMIVE